MRFWLKFSSGTLTHHKRFFKIAFQAYKTKSEYFKYHSVIIWDNFYVHPRGTHFFWKIKLIAQKLATLGKSYQKHGHILQNVPIFPTCVAKCLYKKVLWKKQQFGISKHKKNFQEIWGKKNLLKKFAVFLNQRPPNFKIHVFWCAVFMHSKIQNFQNSTQFVQFFLSKWREMF